MRIIRLLVLVPLAAGGLLPVSLSAQQPFTLEGVRRLVGVGGVELAPDGRTAVITVTRPN